MKIKRIAYLAYYLKELDREKFQIFLNHVKFQNNHSNAALFKDIILSSIKYNISVLEYFQFRFYELDHAQRATYAGTGCMYEYQLVMNPRSSRSCLDNKVEFHETYREFIKRAFAQIETLRKDPRKVELLMNNPSGKIVLKYSRGQCGWQVQIFETSFFKDKDLVQFMEKNGFDLAEEFIVQHPDLMALSPSGVNTVRIITQVNAQDELEILGSYLRISVNSQVDNMAAGNFAAAVDIQTGKITGPGVYSDITKNDETTHPVTSVPIIGFQVPYWEEILSMVKKAAFANPANRSIGWDIAVTPNGPELIEGNHDWCKLVWQLPVKKGLKPLLDRHLTEYKTR